VGIMKQKLQLRGKFRTGARAFVKKGGFATKKNKKSMDLGNFEKGGAHKRVEKRRGNGYTRKKQKGTLHQKKRIRPPGKKKKKEGGEKVI